MIVITDSFICSHLSVITHRLTLSQLSVNKNGDLYFFLRHSTVTLHILNHSLTEPQSFEFSCEWEAAVSAEFGRLSARAVGWIAESFSCCQRYVAAPAALVASPAADHIQVGSSDIQSSEHVHSGLSTPPNRRMRLQPNFTFSHHSAAGPTVHENGLLQSCFPVFSTDCLELAATNSSHQWFFISNFKTFRFNQAFTEHWSDLLPAPLKLRPYGAREIWLLLLLCALWSAPLLQTAFVVQIAHCEIQYSHVTVPCAVQTLYLLTGTPLGNNIVSSVQAPRL